LVAVLRYLMLGFAAFGVAAMLAHPDWPRLLTASLVPARSLRPAVVTRGLALPGTTLTSYGATALLTNPAKSLAQHLLTP
jgi:hypothetical protein